MIKLIHLELYKIIKRKDSWVLYAMCLIPLLYSIGFAMGSGSIEYKGELHSLSALDFAENMFVFGYYIFVFLLSVVFIMLNSFRAEIESSSITLLVNKVCSKRKIYLAKLLAIIIFMTMFALVFVVLSMLAYFLFLKSTMIANGAIFGAKYLKDLASLFAIFFTYIWASILAGFISTRFKVFPSVAIFTVLWAIFMYLKEFNVSKYFSPVYYLLNVVENTGLGSFLSFLIAMVLSAVILLVFTMKNFERSDLG